MLEMKIKFVNLKSNSALLSNNFRNFLKGFFLKNVKYM